MKHIFSSTKDDSIWATGALLTIRPTSAPGISGRRRRWTQTDKARLLSLLDESGLSVMAFSRKTGVPYSALYEWRRHADRRQSRAATPAFAEVRIASPATGTAACVHLPCGARVEAAVGTDPEWIAAIIKAAASA
jgi:transposase-like protein